MNDLESRLTLNQFRFLIRFCKRAWNMENPRILKRSLFGSSFVAAACVGAFVFGGATLAIDYYNHYFGPKSGHGGWSTLLAIIVSIPGQVLIEGTGFNKTPAFDYLYRTIGGYAIAAVMNGVVGAIVFGSLALVFSASSRKSADDG